MDIERNFGLRARIKCAILYRFRTILSCVILSDVWGISDQGVSLFFWFYTLMIILESMMHHNLLKTHYFLGTLITL